MSNRTDFCAAGHSRFSLARQFYAFPWGGLQLVMIASVLHVFLAAGLFIAGRAQLAPTLVDRDGIIDSFAHDSYEYQSGAIQLAQLLRSGEFANWATAAQPVHVKILAIPFSLLGQLSGYGTLSAEPYNVLCYAAVVGLVFALGREVYSRRAGLLAGTAVAVCPTFLLHTTQLLKDSLFIAGALVFVLCVTTWLTRTYSPILAVIVAVLTMFMLLLLFLVRGNVAMVMLAVGLVGLALLILRQYLLRRLLLWNMIATLSVLLPALLFLSFYSNRTSEKVKQFQVADIGQPKIIAETNAQVPTLILRVPGPTKQRSDTVGARWGDGADMMARRISAMRSRFAASYPDSGSGFDAGKEFRNFNDLLGYLPRALKIGLWAPFPYSWVSAGRRVGNMGTLLAAAETFLIYLCQALALLAVMREPRRPALWFLVAISTLGVTALALIVPNLGALYRFRYTFWILVVIGAMAGLDNVIGLASARWTKPGKYRFLGG